MSDLTKASRLKQKNDISGLLDMLENEQDWILSLDAAEALAQLGDKRGFDKLISALDDNDKDVRDVAKEILEGLEKPPTYVLNGNPPQSSLPLWMHLIDAIVGGLVGVIFYQPITFQVVLPTVELISRLTNAFTFWDGTGLGESMVWPFYFLIWPILVVCCFGIMGGISARRPNRSRWIVVLGAAAGGVAGSLILCVFIYFKYVAHWR